MTGGHSGDAIHQVNRLFQAGTVGALTDGQLLERFATRRGEAAEAAFEGLVARHGPMVLRVCRATLRDAHDVEDAFQATFLVLVRKAGSIGERDLLGPWLYGVAHRVALKARGVAARRRGREGDRLTEDPPTDVADGPWLDFRPALHEELDRLPEKYRKPVVLCHLQGLTHSEAAQELAWPVGTVSVRLARARKLLRERLARRGLTATATLWAAGLAAEGASAAVPLTLIRSTTRAAIQYAAGRSLAAGIVSAGAALLTRRTLTMLFVSRLKWIAAPLVLGSCTVGVAVLAQGTPGRLRAEVAQAPPRPDPGRPAWPARRPGDPQAVPGKEADEVEMVPPVARNASGRFEINPTPAGFFDLPADDGNGGTGPPAVQPGRTLVIEVLEALPGRPFTGERVVRPDGTVSLGFYGDLPVAGLNRRQIKVKLIEHMRKYLEDEVLGLVAVGPDGKARMVPPVESTHVFVDDSNQTIMLSPSFRSKQSGPSVVGAGRTLVIEVLEALPGRPITGKRLVRPDGTISLGFYGDLAVAGLNRDEIKVKMIEHLRKFLSDKMLGLEVGDDNPAGSARKAGQKVPAIESDRVFVDDFFVTRSPVKEPRKPDADVEKLRNQVDDLNTKLDGVLRELGELRREGRRAPSGGPAPARPR